MKAIRDPWFSFKGISNVDMGVFMVDMPVRNKAAMNGKQETIGGSDGFLFVSDGTYGKAVVTLNIAVRDPSKIEQVDAWLDGHGDLVFFDQPTQAYDAYCISGHKRQNISKRLEGQSMSITWTCQPFRHETNPQVLTYSRGSTLRGSGTATARPKIVVNGSGSQQLMINRDTFLLELNQGEPLYIDCDAKVAYTIDPDTGAMLFAGNQVSIMEGCSWFTLDPAGAVNTINFTSGITSVQLTPCWRWL